MPDAKALEDLAPLIAELRSMQRHMRPFGSDYSAIAISLSALDEMALHFTGEHSFYGARNDTVGPVARWAPRGES